jgi:2-hydroxy-3-keto-5-methylthiopentenyl-1-phosphate phosphatase
MSIWSPSQAGFPILSIHSPVKEHLSKEERNVTIRNVIQDVLHWKRAEKRGHVLTSGMGAENGN